MKISLRKYEEDKFVCFLIFAGQKACLTFSKQIVYSIGFPVTVFK
jgi:hypothetical protein